MEKTFDAHEAEARLYKTWEDADAFKAGANAKPGAETFCIMLPPPNVTGFLHVGHAFSQTLMDVLIRWKRMQGFDTLWQPGLDHAGIATQLIVEKQLAESSENQTRADMGREAFLGKVWEWKATSGGVIEQQARRMGHSMDWERSAFTMSGNFHDAVIKVFVDMYNKGFIYRGKRLVNWDPHFETAISDLEVENVEVDGHMWHFKYPLAGERDYISIATTRPETMLGDGAVAVHPSDERYAPIIGKLCEIPVGPKEHRRLIPIITDEYPDPDFGSGAVKITGAHDFNDYQVAKRGGIPMYSLMDTKGQMRADGKSYMNLVPDEYRGLDRFEARKLVVENITAEGNAVMVSNPEFEALDEFSRKIMQPFGDRSKVVIEPMLTDQWFVDTDKIVGPALEAVRQGRTKIMPESGEKVFFHWLENIEPWCISRQLWWGHQIPVWYGPPVSKDKQSYAAEPVVPFCAANEEEALKLANDYYGPEAEAYISKSTERRAEREIKNGMPTEQAHYQMQMHEIGKKRRYTIHRDPDVLDTWFSSGLWPFGTLGWPEDTPELAKYFPGDVLVTGQDILFFWVARMMMMSQAVLEDDPFHTVYLHQLVRDAKGEKMSKTRGNVIDPLVMIDEYGADALRFANVQMAALGGVLKISEDRIKGYRNFGTKLWNACRFAEMNEVFEDATPHWDAPSQDCAQTLNKWIIGETAKVREEVDAALTAYRFNDAANALYAFVWGRVCDWYVELSKPLLMGDDEAAKTETRATMRWVLDQCQILLHPIMPFITEELWSVTGTRAGMLVHTDWPTYETADLVDADADREMNWVIRLIEGVRSARTQMHVPASAKIPMLHTTLTNDAANALMRNEGMIKRMARIETLSLVESFPKGCVTIAADGASFALPLADIIDIEEEKTRLEKVLGKLAKDLGGLRGPLNNPKFIASAPAHVVEEKRQLLAAKEEEESKINEALQRLADLA
ncbi:UNVERIFIED_CONTAM: hypothetical protein GTU68_049072 [Idotea baltica]|nr:hypothetical protein [Idotea baltica]